MTREIFPTEFLLRIQRELHSSDINFSELASGTPSQVQRLSPAETMARLIRMNPWSCYDRATAADHLALLSSLVKQATGYQLRAGRDLLDPEFAASLIANYSQNS
jgi:hypothetical protein